MSTRCCAAVVASLILSASGVQAEAPGLSDPEATPETQALFANLKRVAGRPEALFGQQNPDVFGLGWSGRAGRSDVKTAVGVYPALYGYDLLMLFHGKQAPDAEGLLRRRIEEAYRRGGVITISWHMWNPATGRNFYDDAPAVRTILPDGEHHAAYLEKLDRAAAFFRSLEGPSGEAVPVLFRPFHEHTGSWFWWGQDRCSREEFVALWRLTVARLREHHGLHNLLYVYSPSFNASARAGDDTAAHMMERYPGDACVDVIGLDSYHGAERQMREAAKRGLPIVVREAECRGKIPAYTEFGVRKGLRQAWNRSYYTDLAEAIRSAPDACRIAYLMVWQNRDEKSAYWVPCRPGDPHLPDFQAFYRDPLTLFADTAPPMYDLP